MCNQKHFAQPRWIGIAKRDRTTDQNKDWFRKTIEKFKLFLEIFDILTEKIWPKLWKCFLVFKAIFIS